MISKKPINVINGYSLLEVLICLSIVAILISSSLPSLSSWASKNHTEQLQEKYLALLSFARQTAINTNTMVTICKSSDGQNCKGNWSDGSIAFIDNNTNALRDNSDKIIYRINPDAFVSTIYWRSFRNKQYLQITPLGFTNNQSGNFTFCPSTKDLKQARQLIVNRVGRTRTAQDNNKDGYIEDSLGKHLRC